MPWMRRIDSFRKSGGASDSSSSRAWPAPKSSYARLIPNDAMPERSSSTRPGCVTALSCSSSVSWRPDTVSCSSWSDSMRSGRSISDGCRFRKRWPTSARSRDMSQARRRKRRESAACSSTSSASCSSSCGFSGRSRCAPRPSASCANTVPSGRCTIDWKTAAQRRLAQQRAQLGRLAAEAVGQADDRDADGAALLLVLDHGLRAGPGGTRTTRSARRHPPRAACPAPAGGSRTCRWCSSGRARARPRLSP